MELLSLSKMFNVSKAQVVSIIKPDLSAMTKLWQSTGKTSLLISLCLDTSTGWVISSVSAGDDLVALLFIMERGEQDFFTLDVVGLGIMAGEMVERLVLKD
jgi:hypothetical protein